MADRIVVLDKGQIEQVGTPLELYNRPDTLFVAGFIGSPKMNLIGGDAAKSHGAATVGIRPEHIILGQGPYEGTARLAEHLGSDTFLHVDAGDLGPIVVRTSGESPIKPQEKIRFGFDPSRIHRFDQAGKAIR